MKYNLSITESSEAIWEKIDKLKKFCMAKKR